MTNTRRRESKGQQKLRRGYSGLYLIFSIFQCGFNQPEIKSVAGCTMVAPAVSMCIHRDLNICGFWYLRRILDLMPSATEGWGYLMSMYMQISSTQIKPCPPRVIFSWSKYTYFLDKTRSYFIPNGTVAWKVKYELVIMHELGLDHKSIIKWVTLSKYLWDHFLYLLRNPYLLYCLSLDHYLARIKSKDEQTFCNRTL